MKMRHIVLGLVAAVVALPGLASDIDGKWNATVDGGPNGPVELLFDLKAEGETLTGTLSVSMMPTPTPISEGVIKGGDVSFKLAFVMMEGAPPLVISYAGKLDGDDLNLTSVFDMGRGPMETAVAAKRVK